MFITGMLVFFTASARELAVELFREGRWDACRRECRRIEIEQGKHTPPRIRLLGISALSEMNQVDAPFLLDQLAPLITQTEDPETAAIAAYEVGRLQWGRNETPEALEALAFSFHSTTNQTLFLRAACSAFLLMEENPSLKTGHKDLVQQIATTRDLWSGKLFAVSRLERPSSGFSLSPATWFTHFYRSQISPAIGQRCTLDPSCSEYFHQAAGRHHTLLAIPLTADRFVREPGVNNEKKDPVLINGVLRYRDLLDDHDFWMNP